MQTIKDASKHIKSLPGKGVFRDEAGPRKGNELTSSSGAVYRPCRASELDLVVDVKLRQTERSAELTCYMLTCHITSQRRAELPGQDSKEAHSNLQFCLNKSCLF